MYSIILQFELLGLLKIKSVLEINSGNLNIKIGGISITITNLLSSVLVLETNNKCEWADLQVLKRSRCEDKKSLWVSVLYPSCMFYAVEHFAFSHFHLHQTSSFEFCTFLMCFLSFCVPSFFFSFLHSF